MIKKLYQELASLHSAIENCQKSGNQEWLVRHSRRLRKLQDKYLPSGSGFDNGTKFDRSLSTNGKLVLTTSWHHMNDSGSYSGWTDHVVTVVPNFTNDIEIRISGRDRNSIKEYMYDTFYSALKTEIDVHKEYENL